MSIKHLLSILLGIIINNESVKRLVKIELALIYLKILKKMKSLLFYFLGIISFIFLVLMGFFFLIVQFAMNEEYRLELSVWVTVIFIVIPIGSLIVFCVQKNWLKYFGITKLLDDLDSEKFK